MDRLLDHDLAAVEARYKPEYMMIPAFQIVTHTDWILSRAIRDLDARLRRLEAYQGLIGDDGREKTGCGVQRGPEAAQETG